MELCNDRPRFTNGGDTMHSVGVREVLVEGQPDGPETGQTTKIYWF